MTGIEIGAAVMRRQKCVNCFLRRNLKSLHKVRTVKAAVEDVDRNVNAFVLCDAVRLYHHIENFLIALAEHLYPTGIAHAHGVLLAAPYCLRRCHFARRDSHNHGDA